MELLIAAAGMAGGDKALAARLGVKDALMSRFMRGSLKLPDALLLQVVDVILAERESKQRDAILAAVRVLIVDDNADMRSFARFVLQQAGIDAETAANGKRALDLQRDRPADVLVTDMFMPEPDGIELIQRFKSEFPKVRVVAITGGARLGGRGAKEALFAARQIGADAVLEKPFAGDALIRAVRAPRSV